MESNEPDLIIRYHRDFGDTCTGEIVIRWPDGSRPAERLHALNKIAFNKMMSCAGEELNKRIIGRLIMERLDRPNLKSYVFDNPTTELLRSDPVAAIRTMTIPHTHIDLRNSKPGAVFTAGYESLANSFGDEVFARVRADGEVECPGCGMWSKPDAEFIFRCKKKCGIQIPSRFVEKWAIFNTAQLILLALPRYFFPRGWNKFGSWISHKEFGDLYDRWKKEKTS